MATIVTIPPGQLGAIIKRSVRKNVTAIQRGMRHAAERGRTYLVSKTAGGPVDQGLLKNSWTVRETAAGDWLVVNMTPYAGVVERGARPHGVSKEGVQAIYQWVLRHNIGAPMRGGQFATRGEHEEASANWAEKQAWNITWAIVHKLKTKGQKGTFFVRNSLPKLNELAHGEIDKYLDRSISKMGDE